MEWLAIAMMVSSLLPMIKDAIVWVEENAKGQPGTFKKEQVLAYLRAILMGTAAFSKLTPQAIDALMFIVGNLVDTTVTIFNATGKFSKGE